MTRKNTKWGRVLLKLSGQAFAGKEHFGICPDAVESIARDIRDSDNTERGSGQVQYRPLGYPQRWGYLLVYGYI